MLDLEQKDILNEMMNVFVGDAARLLSELTEHRIYLSVPNLNLVEKGSRENMENIGLPEVMKGTMLSSALHFGQRFKGKAELIFPTDKIKELSFICSGEDMFFDAEDDLNDMDFDLMKEIGNIILNSVVGGIANQIEEELFFSPLEVEVFDLVDIRKSVERNRDDFILIFAVSFRVENTEIIGAIIINFSLHSIDFLVRKIDEMRSSLDEEYNTGLA